MNPHYAPRPLDLPTEVPLDPNADLSVLDEAKIFAAPDVPALWPIWRDQLARWRVSARDRVGYREERYARHPADIFVLAMASLWDEALYDHAAGSFTVEDFLRTAEAEFGGLDGVLLWHAYPVVGIDPRRQLDFYREIPELPQVVRAFKAQRVRVFVSYYPWATGPDAHTDREVADLVAWLGADGLFLDSVKEGSCSLRDALDTLDPGLLMGGESRVPLSRITDHQMSWAQWFADSTVPGVLRAKWFERRHILHHTRRWHRSHVGELHSAWLNGSGILVWENVFGVWVGWSERDKAVLRSMRRVHRDHKAWLCGDSWVPLADHPGPGVPVHASRWEHDGVPLWTVANSGDAYQGPWLVTDALPDRHWVELTTGVELTPKSVGPGRVSIGGPLPAGGIAAVRASRARLPLLQTRPSAGDASFPVRVAERVQAPSVTRREVPAKMVAVEGGRRELVSRYRARETGLYGETPFVDEWKPPLGARLHHTARVHRSADLAPFAIDELEVSNAQFAVFLEATGHEPRRSDRFLAHWRGGRCPTELLEAPVSNVDLGDARAYALWAGLRLPTEDEWQVAGSLALLRRRTPEVWNLTESEHTDGRTRFLILKVGSAYRNPRSEWYFDGGVQPADVSAKLLLLGGGLSRSPSIGFRCAVGRAVP